VMVTAAATAASERIRIIFIVVLSMLSSYFSFSGVWVTHGHLLGRFRFRNMVTQYNVFMGCQMFV